MGFWKATEELYEAVDDKLATYIRDVAGEQNVNLDSSFDLFRRARAPSIVNQGSRSASVGIWFRQGQTGAASQKRRDWDVRGVMDYTYRAQDRDETAKQVELVTSALMRVVDDLVERNTVVGASEEPGGMVSVQDLDNMIQEGAGLGFEGPYRAATRLEFPMKQRETLP